MENQFEPDLFLYCLFYLFISLSVNMRGSNWRHVAEEGENQTQVHTGLMRSSSGLFEFTRNAGGPS